MPVPWSKFGVELCPMLDSLSLRGFRVPSLFALDDPQAFSNAQREISDFASAFQHRPLKRLLLQDCEFKSEDWIRLRDCHGARLEEFRLLECINSLEQVRAALGNFKPMYTKLRIFEFRQRHMPEYAKLVVVDCITSLFHQNADLRELYLSDCGRLPKAAWEALQTCSQLRKLICAVQVRTADEDLLTLEATLKSLRHLEELALDANGSINMNKKFVNRILESLVGIKRIAIGHVTDTAFERIVSSGWLIGADVKYGRFEYTKS